MTFYQPYQEASQEYQRQSNQPANTLKKSVNVGLGLATGSTLLNRALPFLSKFIPQDIALKGLSKINPTLGKFISTSSAQGFDPTEIIDFVKEKVGEASQQEEKEPAKQKGNIIQQYSPELFQFLENNIFKGVSPIQASVEARKAKKEFAEAIQNIEKDHNTSFDEIVSSIFSQDAKGKGGSILKKMLSTPENPQEQQAANSAAQQLMARGQQQVNPLSQMSAQDSGDMRQQAMQPGQGQQKLMAAIQQLRQLRGA